MILRVAGELNAYDLHGVQKPIALYFFRQSHELYKNPTNKSLSPAFWESEGKEQESWRGFESVLPGIEHELGERK